MLFQHWKGQLCIILEQIWHLKEEIYIEFLYFFNVFISIFFGDVVFGQGIGIYITIDVKGLKLADDDEIKKISDVLSNELKEMLNIHVNKQEDILIVGLGNIYVTPDALGPKVINEIDVTRHLITYLPQ